jgi:hypothetical protein
MDGGGGLQANRAFVWEQSIDWRDTFVQHEFNQVSQQ